MLGAGALVASLAMSAPAWAQSGADPVSAPRSYSRAIPPESSAVRSVPAVAAFRRVAAMPVAVQPQVAVARVVRAVVAPQAAIPRPTRAVVLPGDPSPRLSRAILIEDAPRPVPAVAFREMADEADDAGPVPAVVRRESSPVRSGLDSATRCVAMAVYHEARGEPMQGQRAVADVVVNRARSGRWGSGACSVVNAPHQFSNRWSWSNPVPGISSWDRAITIAHDALSGVVGVSSRLMNFRAASMGAGSRSFMRLGNHVFWQ